MEYGPGLYLTNYLDTAMKYAKGGGKLYRVTFRKGTDLNDVTLSKEVVNDFINSTRMPGKKGLKEDLAKYTNVPAYIFVNLLIANDCMTPSTSSVVRQFLIDAGIDYTLHRGYGGYGNQVIAVIFNPKIIQTVSVIKSSDIDVDQYILPV